MGKKKQNPISVKVSDDGVFTFSGRSHHITRDKNLALAEYGKTLLQYGLSLVLLPDNAQKQQINKTIGCARVVRNDYLAKRIELYKDKKETLSVTEYKKDQLKVLKKEHPYLKEADKFALESAVEQVEDAYKHFFKGSGFPKFVSRYHPSGNRYTTKHSNGNINLLGIRGVPYVKLPKLGKVRFISPKGVRPGDLLPKGARITSATVIREGQGYRVSLAMERVIDLKSPLTWYEPSDIVAIDMGLKEFCIYGSMSGERVHVKNERFIKKREKRLRRLQKSLSRKQHDTKTHKGSKNYYKAKDRVAKEQRKIANQRKDFQHKLSRKIADSCKVFICEDLNISGMMKNRHLAKEIQSVGWYTFLTMVKYKVERNGGVFRKVSRFYPSSKTCAHCGYKNTELKLSDRYWVCPECHTVINRDENAVDNLLKEGIRLLRGENIFMKTAA